MSRPNKLCHFLLKKNNNNNGISSRTKHRRKEHPISHHSINLSIIHPVLKHHQNRTKPSNAKHHFAPKKPPPTRHFTQNKRSGSPVQKYDHQKGVSCTLLIGFWSLPSFKRLVCTPPTVGDQRAHTHLTSYVVLQSWLSLKNRCKYFLFEHLAMTPSQGRYYIHLPNNSTILKKTVQTFGERELLNRRSFFEINHASPRYGALPFHSFQVLWWYSCRLSQ